ncbi:MAG: hypothetical protein ABIS36_16470 [Chryseolinea sp.]
MKLKALVYCLLTVTLTIFYKMLMAQVANNSISSRSQLILDQSPTNSSTNNATVEWQCVNRKLTNKCLVYHNDQWFTFTPPAKGKYYINLSAGKCKDTKGIQAIVIEGNPCEVNTYKILKCVSQIRYRDSFIEIDSMEAGTTYLVNIDGFLGDYCDFSIQFGSNPVGVSVEGRAMKKLDLSSTSEAGVEKLSWKLPFNLKDSIVSFTVYRRPDHRRMADLRTVMPLEINAKREYQPDYSFADTIQARRPCGYQIAGNMKDKRQIVLDERFVKASDAHQNQNGEFKISFNLEYQDESKLQVLLIDALRDAVLWKRTFTFSEILDRNQSFYVGDEVRKGIGNFKIVVIDLKTRRKREMLYFVDNGGKLNSR